MSTTSRTSRAHVNHCEECCHSLPARRTFWPGRPPWAPWRLGSADRAAAAMMLMSLFTISQLSGPLRPPRSGLRVAGMLMPCLAVAPMHCKVGHRSVRLICRYRLGHHVGSFASAAQMTTRTSSDGRFKPGKGLTNAEACSNAVTRIRLLPVSALPQGPALPKAVSSGAKLSTEAASWLPA